MLADREIIFLELVLVDTGQALSRGKMRKVTYGTHRG